MKLTHKSELHQQLGTYLREKRSESGLTQAEVARKLGYGSPQFVSNFERGLCSPPLKQLRMLVRLYDLNTSELINLIIKEQEQVLNSTLVGKRK